MSVKKDDMQWKTDSWAKPALPKLSNPDNFVRGEDGCYEIVHSSAWGTGLYKIEDPEGQKVTYKDKTTFKLVDNFPRIPKEIWSAWVSLAFHLCEEKKTVYGHPYTGYNHYSSDDNEVSIVFLRKEDDLTQWKAVVPLQEVSGGSVHADFTESCDLLTGEKYDVFPPIGYVHVGSSHSHNTMGAFFSSTDDRSELGIPGLHIVVGKIDTVKMTYTYKASIVLKGQRKIIEELADLVDCTPFLCPFNEVCLEMVHEKKVAVTTTSGSRMGFNGKNSSGGYSGSSSGWRNPTKCYKPGALWDNIKSEWVYLMGDDDDDEDDDDENTEIILLPGDVDMDNGYPDVDFSDIDEFYEKHGNMYTPYTGDAYEKYKEITDQAYADGPDVEQTQFDPDSFEFSDLDELTKQSISEWIGHEVTEDDTDWLKYYLGRSTT